jgi:hypothetical protein
MSSRKAEWLRKGILSIFNARSRLDFIVPATHPRKACCGGMPLCSGCAQSLSDFMFYQLRCAAARRARHKALEGGSVFSGSSPLVARRWLTLPKKAAPSYFIAKLWV